MHRAEERWPVRDLAIRWWPLGVAAASGLALALAGTVPRWPGLTHLVGLPPVDLAADLRILVARSSSYPAFLIGVGVSVAIRTLLVGSLLATLGAVPSFGAGMARAAALYLVAVVPLAVAAAADFAGLAAVYAWYAWAGLGLTVLVLLVISPRLIPRGARFRRIPTILGYLMALTVLGALADLAGEVGAVIGILVSAVFTAVALDRLTRPPGPAGQPAPVAAATAVALALGAPLAAAAPRSDPVAPNAVVLIVPGVDTSSGLGAAYRLDPAAIGFDCDRVFYFSYRGPGEGAPSGEARCPIRLHRPYSQTVTQRPQAELVDGFVAQVEAIRDQTGGAPVVAITHSQGAIIAWRSVSSGLTGVSHLIALSGFPHSPVGYPAPGEDGRGRVGADALRALSWFSRFLGVGAFDPDAPLAREVLARPDGSEAVFARPLPPDVTAALLFATADLIAAPEGHEVPRAATATVDTTHAGMPESDPAAVAIREVLAGRSPGGSTFLAAILDPALPAWLPPPA